MNETVELPPNYTIHQKGKQYSVSYSTYGLRQYLTRKSLIRYWLREDKAREAAWEHYRSMEAQS